MYRPLPKELTIKNSPIEGLGLYAKEDIKNNVFLGVTHIRDEQFENKYIRTPLGGFYNHSNNPNIMRMVSDVLPKLKFGDLVDPNANAKTHLHTCVYTQTAKLLYIVKHLVFSLHREY